MLRWLLILILAMTVAQPMEAFARDYYYFNKPSVTRDQYVNEKLECDRLAGGVQNPSMGAIYVPQYSNLSATHNAVSVALVSLFAGMMQSGERRRTTLAVERTCMADKGYARFKVEKALVKQIDDIEGQDERIDRYFALASMQNPVGERIKE